MRIFFLERIVRALLASGPGFFKKQKSAILLTLYILLAFALPISTVAEIHGSPYRSAKNSQVYHGFQLPFWVSFFFCCGCSLEMEKSLSTFLLWLQHRNKKLPLCNCSRKKIFKIYIYMRWCANDIQLLYQVWVFGQKRVWQNIFS